MTQADSVATQATSSALSPYAEIFVPQHFKKGVATKESQREAVRNQQLTEVPKYLTNCYPFVTDDGPLGKNIHWPAAGRGFSSHNLYAENVLPSCQGYIYISNTPYDYNAGISSCSVDSGILPQFAPTDVDAYRSDHDVQSKKKKSRYSSGVQKKQGAGKVSSIGIRNEPACRLNKPHRSWTMSSALTDAAVQTDLSPDVANLTLSEKPNSLFHSCKMRRSQNKLNPPHNVTDSEVDSDSGYSSPLHRRNLVSNGTPVAPELACLSTPVNECAASYGMTYASIAQRVSKPVPSLTNCRVDMPPDKKVVSENTDTKSTEEGRKKKKRNRKKKKRNDSKPESVASNTSPTSTIVGDQTLHFEDEDEFPELGSVVSSVSLDTLQTRLSYSEKLKGSPVMKQEFTSAQSFEIVSVGSSENKANRISDGRNVRRRYKRQEIANRAAEEELAEITLEQQMLRQLNISKKPVPKASSMKTAGSLVPGVLPVPATITKQPQQQSGKKSKQPIALDIAAMIDALEKRQNDSHKQQHKQLAKDKILKKGPIGNVLDSSAPTIKRGKEKENPKPKKPSPLKKVILKEREEKKRLRLLEVDPSNALTSSSVPVGIGVVNAESDLSQDATSSKGDIGAVTPASADLSPVSQTSPISMSPLSPGTSPISSGVNSPITGIVDKGMNTAILKIHSRRFREYCNQILDKEIDNCCAAVLQDLVSFQDRMFHRDPIKAKMRRRIVLGLREVTKHLKLNKLKCVIISPNLEKIQSKGGLDDALNNILNLCTDQNIPFVFALGRRALGRACAKLVPVSVVGIFNYEGSEVKENFQKLMDLTEKARQSYKDMVALIEKDIQENAGQMHCTTSQVFSHMGHSRTPSGCSVISFTSSILSEPISENYPHSEPETDSKGNEIVQSQQEKNSFNGGGDNIMHSATKHTDSTVCQHQLALHEIDDGNEADTEDCNEVTMKSESESAAEIRTAILPECDDDTNSLNTGLDTLDELPHIDSIHTMNYDLNAEILSQHSVRTVDTSEALSTHSSKTVGEGSSTIIADGCSEQGRLEKSKSRESPINLTKVKTVEKEQRIQDWVDASQTCLEELEQTDEQKVAVVSSPVRVNSPEPNTVSSKVITCTDPLQESITNNL